MLYNLVKKQHIQNNLSMLVLLMANNFGLMGNIEKNKRNVGPAL